MTMKALAHTVQQILQRKAGCPIKRSHVHELLAAAFGYRSWAAFLSEALLADSGVGNGPSASAAGLIGRAVQLGYPQRTAELLARSLLEFVAECEITSVTWSVVRQALAPAIERDDNRFDDDDDDDDGWGDEEPPQAALNSGPTREQLALSAMLRQSLEHAAEGSNAQAHFLLAALYRCDRPNPYLYEESLKGRVLTAIERSWVDDYLRLEPQYRKYETHLKAAALGGVRAASLEYGRVFENHEFIAFAERLSGDVDPLQMMQVATTSESRARWLRIAAERGSRTALQQLADQGDAWAEELVAQWGDTDWLRTAAERALGAGDGPRAWTWQYLALKHGVDLTRSTMAAYHDGGQNNGQFYDSDFGGPLYVDGDEGLVLPQLNHAGHREAEAAAERIFGKSRRLDELM